MEARRVEKIEFMERKSTMTFLKIFMITLWFFGIFTFFGGLTLFDFSGHPFLAPILISLIISVFVSVFCSQAQRIEQLEKRVEELEKDER